MKERGKRAMERNDDVSFSDCYYYSTSSELPCRKHPSVSAVGICPYCLNDRLVNLVCSECGEQRLSSCSCSDFSPNRRSSSAAVDVGSVGRISFLIDNEKNGQNEGTNKQGNSVTKAATTKGQKTEEIVVFKRSSSSCVEIKRKNHHGFWRIGRFFRKINPKRDRDFGVKGVHDSGGFDEKSDSWLFDYNEGKKIGVSRSRSLCSFRGNGYFIGSEDGSSYSGARSSISAARSSSVNGGLGFCETEPRKSGFEGRKSGFSETEHRKSGFSEAEPPRRSFFEGRRSNFSETEHRKSNFSETEPPRRSCFEPRKSNFSETEHRKSNFSETEPRRSFFEGRRSNFSETENRRSCFEGRRSNFSESENHRKSDAANFTRRVFSLKESYFTGVEEPGFIDLKFDFSSSSDKDRQEPSVFGSARSYGDGLPARNDGVLNHGGGGSCRMTAREGETRKSRKSFKGWRNWIFGQNHQTVRKKDDHERHEEDDET